MPRVLETSVTGLCAEEEEGGLAVSYGQDLGSHSLYTSPCL